MFRGHGERDRSKIVPLSPETRSKPAYGHVVVAVSNRFGVLFDRKLRLGAPFADGTDELLQLLRRHEFVGEPPVAEAESSSHLHHQTSKSGSVQRNCNLREPVGWKLSSRGLYGIWGWRIYRIIAFLGCGFRFIHSGPRPMRGQALTYNP